MIHHRTHKRDSRSRVFIEINWTYCLVRTSCVATVKCSLYAELQVITASTSECIINSKIARSVIITTRTFNSSGCDRKYLDVNVFNRPCAQKLQSSRGDGAPLEDLQKHNARVHFSAISLRTSSENVPGSHRQKSAPASGTKKKNTSWPFQRLNVYNCNVIVSARIFVH